MALPPLACALSHRCPECGEGRLYRNWLTIRPQCEHCGYDLQGHDVGVGPAFFTITLLGFVVVGTSFAAEIFFRPSYWVHAMIVILSMMVLTPVSLRFFKSYLIAMKHRLHHQQKDV